jgi:endonuclease/exonuclease/phosphatase family metal-dependent hydrolase
MLDRSRTHARRLTVALLLLAGTGCATGRNYTALDGPRYAGGAPVPLVAPEPDKGRPLRVVSFNIEYALRVETAIAVMTADPETRAADVILLQEMDEASTRRVAEAFGMSYVYYPGTFRLKLRKDFGNAILSRWPIIGDSKILLPHKGLLGGTQRIAVGATIRVGREEVRVYSTHLGTMINAGPGARRAQLSAVLADADRYPHVIIGGDMNSHGVGGVARARGYAWPTRDGPRTTRFGRWDHIFLKGLGLPGDTAAGTVLDVRGASDHRAVWATGVLPSPAGQEAVR